MIIFSAALYFTDSFLSVKAIIFFPLKLTFLKKATSLLLVPVFSLRFFKNFNQLY